MATKRKNIHIMTMVRNDPFLKKWVEYYGRELGRENLHVIFDGKDQEIPDWCEGVKVTLREKAQGDVVQTDRDRARYISDEAAKLYAEGADMVIATDADEFLAVDPALGLSLRDFLSGLPERPTWSGLGIDVMQKIGDESEINFDISFLTQRRYGMLYSRYTKASVTTKPLIWGSGFHRVKGHNYHIAEGLYLFHFGNVDLKRLESRAADPSRATNGWQRHEDKRIRAIKDFSKSPVMSWSPTVDVIRRMQRVCRPIFAINKPTTYGLKYVVEIPERFKSTGL